MSPLQGISITGDFPHGSRHELQPATLFEVQVSAIGQTLKRPIKRQALATQATIRFSLVSLLASLGQPAAT